MLNPGELVQSSSGLEIADAGTGAFLYGRFTWRMIAVAERLLAALLLLLWAPFLLAAAVVIAMLSRRPPLIAHRRAGSHGRQIWVLKLRTMWGGDDDSDPSGFQLVERLPDRPVPEVKAVRDHRVSSQFALFCRRYSIDELPQLWQVVSGEMALVGPRPLTFAELAKHYGSLGAALLRAKPGLTGLWQVRGRNRLTYRQRRKLDEFMLNKWSIRLYFRILLATIPCVVFGKDAY